MTEHEITEADEVALARNHPTAHPLSGSDLSRVYKSGTEVGETTVILPTGQPYSSRQALLRAARWVVTAAAARHARGCAWDVRFWFENQLRDEPGADFASGDVQSWTDDGEITFTDGTRLNDALLLRVTF